MIKEKEQWKPIPDFPDYEVSNMGLVRSWKNRLCVPRILKPGTHPGGYRTVLLRRNGRSHGFPIGRLVLLAFHGPCPTDYEMCHNDGDPTNDHLDNLRWDTHAANMADAVRHNAWSKSTNGEQMKNITSRTNENEMEIENYPFVQAVKREQERRGGGQVAFSQYLGITQGALSKFYKRGPKDNVVIKVLRKFPHLVVYLTSEDPNA